MRNGKEEVRIGDWLVRQTKTAARGATASEWGFDSSPDVSNGSLTRVWGLQEADRRSRWRIVELKPRVK